MRLRRRFWPQPCSDADNTLAKSQTAADSRIATLQSMQITRSRQLPFAQLLLLRLECVNRRVNHMVTQQIDLSVDLKPKRILATVHFYTRLKICTRYKHNLRVVWPLNVRLPYTLTLYTRQLHTILLLHWTLHGNTECPWKCSELCSSGYIGYTITGNTNTLSFAIAEDK